MITLVTDGAYSSKHKMGGWACLVIEGDHVIELSGHEHDTTNNRMELTAVIEGFKNILREYDAPMPVVVISDSNYIIKAMNDRWVDKWELRMWRTASGENVKNRDLWEELVEIVRAFHQITWSHVKGHAGNHLNERADLLAVAAREAGHKARQEAMA